MRGEILGLERRRRWHDDEKLAIVQSVGVGGATVTQVAQRHDLRRQRIYAWRHELRKKGLLASEVGTVFLPIEFSQTMPEPSEAAPSDAGSGQIEVVLRNGRSLRFDAPLAFEALRQLIQTVESA